MILYQHTIEIVATFCLLQWKLKGSLNDEIRINYAIKNESLKIQL